MQMRIVVEGIERAEQAQLLDRLGCTEGQGFLYSTPLPYLDLIALLSSKAGPMGAMGHA
jgi:EAL domain-containing protein (putative c-di-GMP-specific phosphodiesterase class I)